MQKEQLLRGFTHHTVEMDLNRKQWLTIVESYRTIDEALLLYLHGLSTLPQRDLSPYLDGYTQLMAETRSLLKQIPAAWRSKDAIAIPKPFTPKYNSAALRSLPLLTSAHITNLMGQLCTLHEALRRLAGQLEDINSPLPTSFTLAPQISDPYFSWTDPETLKGSIVTFLVFWASVTCWIVQLRPNQKPYPPAGCKVRRESGQL